MKRVIPALALAALAGCSRTAAPLPHDEPGEALEYYRSQRVPVGSSEIPMERYFTALARIRRMRVHSPKLPRAASFGAWEWLGPGNVGGRTRDLVIHPQNPAIMYTAGVSGGVWKTLDGGKRWEPMGDLLPNIAVASLALDPVNPGTVYAGTGEGFGNFGAVRGAGIFKTTDGGANWVRLESTNRADFFFVNKVLISPFDSNRLYAATATGVWRSRDGGETWTNSLDRARVPLGCQDLVIRPDRAEDTLFAACRGNPSGGIWRNRSAAGDGDWQRVFTAEFMARTSLAIAPSQPSTVYALAASSQPGDCPSNPGPSPAPQCYRDGMLGVYRSVQDGDPDTWETRATNADENKLNAVLLSNPFVYFADVCRSGQKSFSNQGWYDNTLAVDPRDPDKVWAGGIDLFRSDDGGANWGIASYWWDNARPGYAHADQHAVLFHPGYDGDGNQTMFVTNDGGVYRTDNARAATAKSPRAPCSATETSIAWTPLNNNYGVTQFYHGAVYPGGHVYLAGAQDNGTQRGSDGDGDGSWAEVIGGDGGYAAVNPRDARIVFGSVTRLSLRRSTDGGLTFFPATVGISEPAANFFFITPFRLDPSDPERIWLGGRGLWRSDSGARSWRRASGELSTSSVGAIAISPADPNRVLAGTRNGDIFRNLQATAAEADTTWERNRPRVGSVSWIEFDPVDPDVVYAAYSNFNVLSTDRHLYRSNDAGATWTPADGEGAAGIPDLPVHSIAIHPEIRGTIYAGSDLGIFVTQDGGQTWAKEDAGFPNVVVESMTFEKAGTGWWLFAFTYGRGAFRVWLGPGDRCTYRINTEERTVPLSGGAISFDVETQPGCPWSAVSQSRWLLSDAPINTQGSGTITYRASAGPARRGAVMVADKLIRVVQSAP